MATDPSRYVENNLSPIYDEEILQSTRVALGKAIVFSITEIEKNLQGGDAAAIPKLYIEQVGESVALLRLYAQATKLGLPDAITARLPPLIKSILDPCFTNKEHGLSLAASSDPAVRKQVLYFGRCGVINSPVGPAVVEITRQILISGDADGDDAKFEQSLAVLEAGFAACFEATDEQDLHGDMVELMWGTTGYLYGILGLRALVDQHPGTQTSSMWKARNQRLLDLVSDASIKRMVDEIIHTGVHGSGRFREMYGHTPPLMWRDFRLTYSLGGIHGLSGVLLILLQCPRHIIEPYLNGHIMPTVDWLVAQQREGNTARAYPPDLPHVGGPPWLCQFCHGAIGTGLLLCVLKRYFPISKNVPRSIAEKAVMRQQAMEECVEFIWREGLVRKGIGICHGVTGNAAPLLLQGAIDVEIGISESLSLGRALAMLRYATGMPPLNMPQSEQAVTLPNGEPAFRVPDHPYYLFEGLAGAVCIWADALILLNNAAAGNRDVADGMLGFPLAGGLGVRLPL